MYSMQLYCFFLLLLVFLWNKLCSLFCCVIKNDAYFSLLSKVVWIAYALQV